MRITGELIGVLRREQRRHAVGPAMHVVTAQPLGKLVAARVDARPGLALFGLEQRELLLGVAALALELGQLAHHAGDRALGVRQRFRRTGSAGLGAGHVLLQVLNALLEIVEVGAALGDLARRLGQRHFRRRGAAQERDDQGKCRPGVSMQHAVQRPRVPQHSILRCATGAAWVAHVWPPRAPHIDSPFSRLWAGAVRQDGAIPHGASA